MILSFWLELFIRSTVFLLLGEGVLRLLKDSRAAIRHRFLLGLLSLLSILPLLTLLIPAIPIAQHHPPTALPGGVTVIAVTARAPAGRLSLGPSWPVWIYLLGVVISSLPPLLGAITVGKLAKGAHKLPSGIDISHALDVPLCCGIFHGRILLPAQAQQWPAARLQAVLMHEQAHILRHDVALQIAARLIASLWWFQPLVWLLLRQLHSESELACDAEVIRSGYRASLYAAELLAVATDIGTRGETPYPAVAMVRAGSLESRIEAILFPRAADIGRGTAILTAPLAIAVAVAAAAVSFPSRESLTEPGGSIMKRALFSALLSSAGLSAATIGGSVHDTSGAPLGDSKVTIINPDTGTRKEFATDSGGRFTVSGSEAGQYILKIEKPGYASILREFDVQAESDIEREFTMPTEGASTIPDMVIGKGSAEQVKKVRVGGEVAQNNLIQKVQPIYPVNAKAAHIQGTVELEAAITKDGVPSELRVVSSPDDELSSSSLEAVRQWRYRPTLLNGNPVPIVTTVIVHFTLSQ